MAVGIVALLYYETTAGIKEQDGTIVMATIGPPMKRLAIILLALWALVLYEPLRISGILELLVEGEQEAVETTPDAPYEDEAAGQTVLSSGARASASHAQAASPLPPATLDAGWLLRSAALPVPPVMRGRPSASRAHIPYAPSDLPLRI